MSSRFDCGQTRRVDPDVVILDIGTLPAMLGRGLVGLGISVAGAGILACFATVGALGMLAQRCAAWWSYRAKRARERTAR